MAGRPTKYTPEMCDRIIEAGKEGQSIAEMAATLDVAIQTVYNWAEEHPAFLDAFTRAQDASEAYWGQFVRKGLCAKPSDFQGPATLKYMAQRFPRWREKSEVHQTVKDDRTPDSTVLEAIHSRLDSLAAKSGAGESAGGDTAGKD